MTDIYNTRSQRVGTHVWKMITEFISLRFVQDAVGPALTAGLASVAAVQVITRLCSFHLINAENLNITDTRLKRF